MNGAQNTTSAQSLSSFSSLAQRPSAFSTAVGATKKAMATTQGFMPSTQQSIRPPITSQNSFSLPLASVNVDRDATMPIGTPYSASSSTLSTALIRRLPMNTSEETLRLMMVFSKDLHSVEVLPVEQSSDPGFRSALLKFKTPSGALEVKNMLDGKSNISNDADMVVEILDTSPLGGRRYPLDVNLSANASTGASSAASSAASSRQPSRFNATFQSLNLAAPDSSAHYHNIFSPQSPIGNHLTDRHRMSGKTLINNDAEEDDETGELIKDPLAFAENGSLSRGQRRSTVPALPVSRMASLSLNTSVATSPASMSGYGPAAMGPIVSASSSMSPTVMGNSAAQMGFNQHYRTHHYPPANPADQNPPCNTLYVGNLPIDTSEEELKAMFSKCRGYKRLCFRTKQNGPMCFVEFEDVSAATKALHELYGHPLHNSVKGGIRLSFSKNPLGVRSSQNPAQIAATSLAPGMSGSAQPTSGRTQNRGERGVERHSIMSCDRIQQQPFGDASHRVLDAGEKQDRRVPRFVL
ncbi:hypothetical protein P8C59_009463 [Phyllachora maydis]|uniref:RRM domain-containing protein n=1 Tax=Phyllachora maydis TaxID=1825666 RepID=A0AAD9MFM8_9PEZI|nr:hypothetical protein P8C59_009463 [Phyllachora maydis]